MASQICPLLIFPSRILTFHSVFLINFNQFSNSYQLQTLTSFSTRNIFQGSIFFCNSFIKTFPLLVTKFLQPPILLAATLNGKWTDNLIPNFSNQLPRMHPCWFYVDIYLRSCIIPILYVSCSISAVVSKLGRYNVVIWQEYKHKSLVSVLWVVSSDLSAEQSVAVWAVAAQQVPAVNPSHITIASKLPSPALD